MGINLMVWKKIKKYTEEEVEHISKRAIKVKTKPLFFYAHTKFIKIRDCKQSNPREDKNNTKKS